MAKIGEELEKVAKSGEKWGIVAKSGEKWEKVANSCRVHTGQKFLGVAYSASPPPPPRTPSWFVLASLVTCFTQNIAI